MDNEKSRLIKPFRRWREDLPDPEEEQMVYPRLIRVNEINDVWMEIPRYEDVLWGTYWVFGSLLIIPLIISFSLFYLHIVMSGSPFLLANSFALFASASLLIYCIRMALFAARGAPVRFNRKQQKVYVYEQRRGLPWFPWPTTIKVFDWADIQGERVEGRTRPEWWSFRIYCAVCQPGTYIVEDRFLLAWNERDIHVLYGLWSACCQYMQGKAVSDKPLRTDVLPSWTPFETVHWPEDMDKASKAVPEWA